MKKAANLPILNRHDLIEYFAKKQNISFVEAEQTVKILLMQIFHHLQRGQRIELRGLGSFSAKRLPSYQGHHPKTGAAMMIPERMKLSFKASKNLLGLLNNKVVNAVTNAPGELQGS
jgi:integration host factor subunit beta